MRLFNLIFVLSLLIFMVACNQEQPTNAVTSSESQDYIESNEFEPIESYLHWTFVHGIVVNIDGEDYYFAGAPDGPNGEIDVPGHDWIQIGRKRFIGKHYNTGPFGAAQWWSSDASDGELLYYVLGKIDIWTAKKARNYNRRGFTHYHEFVKVSDGSHHPTKVVWLKHIAVTSFTLDGGPRPDLAHAVTPGVDYEFIPNASNPYSP